MMVQIKYNIYGLTGLTNKVESLMKKIEKEPNRTIQKMGDSAQLFAMMQAPKRTGDLARNIKRFSGRNYVILAQGPVNTSANNGNPVYPLLIDQSLVRPEWGVLKKPGMIDMRDRSEKLNYFVGTKENRGKTLEFVEYNFPRQVEELHRRLKF